MVRPIFGMGQGVALRGLLILLLSALMQERIGRIIQGMRGVNLIIGLFIVVVRITVRDCIL